MAVQRIKYTHQTENYVPIAKSACSPPYLSLPRPGTLAQTLAPCLTHSAADKENNRAFYEESVKIGTHGQNCILNKMRPKATSGLTFSDRYTPKKAIYVIDFYGGLVALWWL